MTDTTAADIQRMLAKAKADDVRLRTASLRRSLANKDCDEGARDLADMIETLEEGIEAVRLNKALEFVHRVARHRRLVLLSRARITESRAQVRIRELTVEERRRIAGALRSMANSYRYGGTW